MDDSELILKFCKKSNNKEFDIVGYNMMLSLKNKKLELRNMELLKQINNPVISNLNKEYSKLQKKNDLFQQINIYLTGACVVLLTIISFIG